MGCFFFRGLNPRSAPYSNPPPPSLLHRPVRISVIFPVPKQPPPAGNMHEEQHLMKVRRSRPLRSDGTILSTMTPQKSGSRCDTNSDSLTLQVFHEAVPVHLTIQWGTAMARVFLAQFRGFYGGFLVHFGVFFGMFCDKNGFFLYKVGGLLVRTMTGFQPPKGGGG